MENNRLQQDLDDANDKIEALKDDIDELKKQLNGRATA